VDRSCVDALAAAGTIAASEYDWKRYPFTASGWNEFVGYWNNNQQDAKPRDICDKLETLIPALASKDRCRATRKIRGMPKSTLGERRLAVTRYAR